MFVNLDGLVVIVFIWLSSCVTPGMVPFFTIPLGCDGSQKLFDGSVNQDLAIVKHTFLLQPIIGLQPISYKIMLFHNTIFNMHHPHSYVLQYIIIYVSEYHACNKGSEPSQSELTSYSYNCIQHLDPVGGKSYE